MGRLLGSCAFPPTTLFSSFARSSSLELCGVGGGVDPSGSLPLLDEVARELEPVVPPEHLIADEDRRHAEDAAVDGLLCVRFETCDERVGFARFEGFGLGQACFGE